MRLTAAEALADAEKERVDGRPYCCSHGDVTAAGRYGRTGIAAAAARPRHHAPGTLRPCDRWDTLFIRTVADGKCAARRDPWCDALFRHLLRRLLRAELAEPDDASLSCARCAHR